MGLPSLDLLSGSTPTATPLLSNVDDHDNEGSPTLHQDTVSWLSQPFNQTVEEIPATTAVGNSPQTVGACLWLQHT